VNRGRTTLRHPLRCTRRRENVRPPGQPPPGCGAAWQRASFGTKRSWVQIPPPRHSSEAGSPSRRPASRSFVRHLSARLTPYSPTRPVPDQHRETTSHHGGRHEPEPRHARTLRPRRPRLDSTRLANRLHCSRSTISRLETGAQTLDDVATIRRLAEVLEITPTALGITATVTIHPPAEDDVRRCQLLTGLAVTAA